jgi:hypothetical protein
MSYAYGNLASDSNPASNKKAVHGIGASGDVGRLLSTLARLGLCPTELTEPLTKLAASGGRVGDLFEVSVYDLGHAMKNVDVDLSRRMLRWTRRDFYRSLSKFLRSGKSNSAQRQRPGHGSDHAQRCNSILLLTGRRGTGGGASSGSICPHMSALLRMTDSSQTSRHFRLCQTLT